jgi:hypothetical protein
MTELQRTQLLKEIQSIRKTYDVATEQQTYWALSLAIDILIGVRQDVLNIDLDQLRKPD